MKRRPSKRRLKSIKAIARACMWPPPCYIAHFTDGHARRMTFWSQAGKRIDTERGKHLCKLVEPDREFQRGEIQVDGYTIPEWHSDLKRIKR